MCFLIKIFLMTSKKNDLYCSFFVSNRNLIIEHGKIGKIPGFLFKIPGISRFPRKVATGFN